MITGQLHGCGCWLPLVIAAAAGTRQGRLWRPFVKPLTEPGRQSRNSQLSGARDGNGRRDTGNQGSTQVAYDSARRRRSVWTG